MKVEQAKQIASKAIDELSRRVFHQRKMGSRSVIVLEIGLERSP